MREATGELNMTVVTVVAIAAVSALFYAFVWPSIQSAIRNQSCSAITDNHGESYHAVISNQETSDEKAIWVCCDASITATRVTLNATTLDPTGSFANHCTSGSVE